MIMTYTDHIDHITRFLKEQGIDVVKCEPDLYLDGVRIYIEKKGHRLSQMISRYDIEDGVYTHMVKNMVLTIEKMIEENNMTINPIDEFATVVGNAMMDKINNGVLQSITRSATPSMPGRYVMNHKTIESDLFDSYDLIKIYEMKQRIRDQEALMYNTLSLGYKSQIQPHLVFAGGFFTSLYHEEHAKDVDIFILDDQKTRDYILNRVSESRTSVLGRYTIRNDVSYMNNSNLMTIVDDNITKHQYIFTKYKTRQALLNHFDVEHACVSYQNDSLFITPLTLDCIKRKVLKNHRQNKIAPWRQDKFIKKGFKFEIDGV